MKKLIAVLMTLCLLMTACAAVADMDPPEWDSMPMAITLEEDPSLDESAFAGEWELNVAFLDTVYLTEQELAELGYNFMPFTIGDGKVQQDVQQENGEFVTVEAPYVFEAGQLQGKTENGSVFAFDMLEDGNIVLSLFLPGEGETVRCLSVFMKRPAEE